MPKNAKQQVKAYLDRQAVDAKSTRSGLSFSLGGRRYQLWHDKNDPDFLRLTTPVMLDVTRDNYARVIMAANTLNAKCKVSKAVVYDFDDADTDSAWICFEQVLVQDCPDSLLGRIFDMMATAAEEFEEMIEYNEY